MTNLTTEEKALIIEALRSHKAGLEHILSLNSVMAPGKPEDEAKFEANVIRQLLKRKLWLKRLNKA